MVRFSLMVATVRTKPGRTQVKVHVKSRIGFTLLRFERRKGKPCQNLFLGRNLPFEITQTGVPAQPLPSKSDPRLVSFATFDQSEGEMTGPKRETITMTNTETKTMTKTNTFREQLQRAILKTCEI